MGIEPAPKRHLGLLVVSLVLSGAIDAVALSYRSPVVWRLSIGALLRNKARYAGELLRVGGVLVPGTLVQTDAPCSARFNITDGASSLPVNFPDCALPDTLRDRPFLRPEVTAEGVLAPDGHFEAKRLLVKVASPYEMRAPR